VNDDRGFTEEQTRQFTNGLLQELRKKGYDCAFDGKIIKISKNGSPMMSLYLNGDYKPHNTSVSDNICEIRTIRQTTKEAYENYYNGKPLGYKNLTRYRSLAAFNGVVLAARMENDSSCLEYVTWRQTHGNTGVESGNYFSDYEAAKEDFASRAGLVNRYKMFTETELKLLHQGLVHLGANYPHLSTEQMINVGKLIEKVEIIVPAIQARSVQEAHGLVAEDGLEI